MNLTTCRKNKAEERYKKFLKNTTIYEVNKDGLLRNLLVTIDDLWYTINDRISFYTIRTKFCSVSHWLNQTRFCMMNFSLGLHFEMMFRPSLRDPTQTMDFAQPHPFIATLDIEPNTASQYTLSFY
jgi:hypothetical protein